MVRIIILLSFGTTVIFAVRRRTERRYAAHVCSCCIIPKTHTHTHTHTHIYIYIYIYRMSQEECARLRDVVPYVKVYRYNPKHIYPKLNGYGDNGQRKVWSSGGSTHCTCQLTSLIDVYPWVWCPFTESQLTLTYSRLIPECAVSHVMSVLAIHVSCIVLGTLRTTMTCVRVFL